MISSPRNLMAPFANKTTKTKMPVIKEDFKMLEFKVIFEEGRR